MSKFDFSVDTDITQAFTIPTDFYNSPQIFEEVKERIFARSWQCIGLTSDLTEPESVQPFLLMPGYLDEPLLLSRDSNNELHCLSNVCTHRGNILVDSGGPCSEFRCKYHGKRFELDGKFKSMPQFKEAKNFPSPKDDLPKTALETFGMLLFTSIDPAFSFGDWMRPVMERMSFLPLDEFYHSPEHSLTYEVNAHWALYLDNYLEGFHIPFVHPALNSKLSFPDYTYELFDYANLQLGVAKEGEEIFDLPENHPDAGKGVHAFYFWLFPNLMFNFYPWGLSLNIVTPVSPTKTQVRFETFVWKDEIFSQANVDIMHMTEMEDEEIVEMVQRGVKARLYKKGRYSPKMEVAVHHFHRLLSTYLSGS